MSRWKVNLLKLVLVVLAWLVSFAGFMIVSKFWEWLIGVSWQNDIPIAFYGGIIGVGAVLTLHIVRGRK